MNKSRKGFKSFVVAVLMGLSVLLSACDDNPISYVLHVEPGDKCALEKYGGECR